MIDPTSSAARTPAPLSGPIGDKAGIAIIANDAVMHWLLPFLESWQATNAALPMHLIPYDDNVRKTREVAKLYGVNFADIDSRALDALSKKLYPFSLGKRFRLRKLLSLALPLDRMIYLDVDIALFRDLRPLLSLIEPGEADFVVIERTNEYVYNHKHTNYPYLREATTFNDGFFITSNQILTVQDFYDAMDVDEKTFDEVRQRGGLYAQPLVNFVVHRKRLAIATVRDLVPGASGESYHKAKGITFDADGPKDPSGNAIYFAHWAGITGAPKGGAFDDAWAALAKAAAERLKAAGLS